MDAFAIRNGDAARSLTGGPRGRQTPVRRAGLGSSQAATSTFCWVRALRVFGATTATYSKGREPVSQSSEVI